MVELFVNSYLLSTSSSQTKDGKNIVTVHLFCSKLLFSSDFRRKFDFSTPARLDTNLEMMMMTEKALIQNECIARPAIFLRPECEKIYVSKLKVKFKSCLHYIKFKSINNYFVFFRTLCGVTKARLWTMLKALHMLYTPCPTQ